MVPEMREVELMETGMSSAASSSAILPNAGGELSAPRAATALSSVSDEAVGRMSRSDSDSEAPPEAPREGEEKGLLKKDMLGAVACWLALDVLTLFCDYEKSVRQSKEVRRQLPVLVRITTCNPISDNAMKRNRRDYSFTPQQDTSSLAKIAKTKSDRFSFCWMPAGSICCQWWRREIQSERLKEAGGLEVGRVTLDFTDGPASLNKRISYMSRSSPISRTVRSYVRTYRYVAGLRFLTRTRE